MNHEIGERVSVQDLDGWWNVDGTIENIGTAEEISGVKVKPLPMIKVRLDDGRIAYYDENLQPFAVAAMKARIHAVMNSQDT